MHLPRSYLQHTRCRVEAYYQAIRPSCVTLLTSKSTILSRFKEENNVPLQTRSVFFSFFLARIADTKCCEGQSSPFQYLASFGLRLY